jgi:hypothetical protein
MRKHKADCGEATKVAMGLLCIATILGGYVNYLQWLRHGDDMGEIEFLLSTIAVHAAAKPHVKPDVPPLLCQVPGW